VCVCVCVCVYVCVSTSLSRSSLISLSLCLSLSLSSSPFFSLPHCSARRLSSGRSRTRRRRQRCRGPSRRVRSGRCSQARTGRKIAGDSRQTKAGVLCPPVGVGRFTRKRVPGVSRGPWRSRRNRRGGRGKGGCDGLEREGREQEHTILDQVAHATDTRAATVAATSATRKWVCVRRIA
jgi:hypothetical protein